MDSTEFFRSKLPAAPDVLAELKSKDPCNCTNILANEEIRSIYFYSTDHDEFSYKTINNTLEQQKMEHSEIKFQIEKIDTGLAKLQPYKGQCLRGEDFGGYIYNKTTALLAAKPESPTPAAIDMVEYMCSNFFMSATIDVKSAHLQRNVKIIALSKGGARNISHISAYPDEQEFLFQRNAKFVLTRVEQQADNSMVISLMEV